MQYISAASFFLVIYIFLYALLKKIFSKKIKVDQRLEYIENMEKQEYLDPELSFGERVIVPLFSGIGKRFTAFSPDYITKRKRGLLERAGYLKNTTYERLVARRVMTSIVITAFSILVMIILKVKFIYIFFVVIWVFAFIQIVYRFTTTAAVTNRSKQIVRDLPYMLDLITVSVEAGLSLDGAIGRIVFNIPGVLSEEFSKTLKEMRMGIDKKQALRNMSDRCDVRDLSILVNALIQADELGVSLGKVLRIEGSQLREKRKQAAKEKAMKAPVKILFPMLIFIFPAIFVIILGPAVILMMEMF